MDSEVREVGHKRLFCYDAVEGKLFMFTTVEDCVRFQLKFLTTFWRGDGQLPVQHDLWTQVGFLTGNLASLSDVTWSHEQISVSLFVTVFLKHINLPWCFACGQFCSLGCWIVVITACVDIILWYREIFIIASSGMGHLKDVPHKPKFTSVEFTVTAKCRKMSVRLWEEGRLLDLDVLHWDRDARFVKCQLAMTAPFLASA